MTETSEAEPHPVPPEATAEAGRSLAVYRLFGFFLADTSLFRRFRFQLVFSSRFLSEVGQEGIFYGSLVQVATTGTVFQSSLIGIARVLPGALLGFFGGAIADALPRRVGLGLGYALQGGVCVIFPIFIDKEFEMLFLLVLAVGTLNEFVGPSEKAVLPLVSTREEISSAAASLSLADSVATGFGTAIVAPILLAAFGVNALFFVCAVFLFAGSMRIFALPVDRNVTVSAALRRVNLSEVDLGLRAALGWLLGWPAVLTMIMAGMIVTVFSKVAETLGPSYVSEVLGQDPARAVYVFAPAGLGAVAALFAAPRIVDKFGERTGAAVAVLVMAIAAVSLGFIEQLAPLLAPLSPMNVVRLFGLEPGDDVLAASFVSLFTGFAVSMSSVSVQTYVNRRVPNLQQGRVFGLQSVLANAGALLPLLVVGFLAERTSIEAILVVMPWLILAGIYALLLVSSRAAGVEPPSGKEVLTSFWHEPGSDSRPADGTASTKESTPAE